MISLNNVTKYFGPKAAVRDLTLDVKRGELFAFLGPNGAGKTTTIKMIVGLLRPSGGSISVCGFDVERRPIEAKARMSYIPDQPYLYDKLTGREFLQFVSGMYRMDPGTGRKRIESMIETFDLADYVDELAESYSHGMKQRVVISAALLHDPEVLLVDEPMVGLDPKSARIVKNIFREKARSGVSIFMSTHTLATAEELADRVGIIHNGRLIAAGTIAELAEKNRTTTDLEAVFLELTEGRHE